MNVGSANLKSTNKKSVTLSSENNDNDKDNVIKFNDSTFAQLLIPHIDLIGITKDYIKRLSPYNSMRAWTNIGINDKDIEDASYLLLDNNTKLLRSGGLLNDKYISSVSICDLTSTEHKSNDNDNDDNNINNNLNVNWMSLPKLSHRRHGHDALCCNLLNERSIIVIGGFDSKGNTITKSECISLNNIQSHIKQSLINKNDNNSNNNNNNKRPSNKSNKSNKRRNSNNNNNNYWNNQQIGEMPIGIADFGKCYDPINNRIYLCGGLDSQFRSLSNAICYDMETNKWLNLPKLNYQRHCNRSQLLYNPNILMTFGGWTGMSRNTIEIIDLRSNSNKWKMCINDNKSTKNNTNNNNNKQNGMGIFNYPHSNCASIVKQIENECIQKKMNGLNIKSKESSSSSPKKDNYVIVCGHRQGLFIETNVIEALDLRTRKWETIAQFKYAKNFNINQNIINAQQTVLPKDNADIDVINLRKYHRHSNAFRYLSLI